MYKHDVPMAFIKKNLSLKIIFFNKATIQFIILENVVVFLKSMQYVTYTKNFNYYNHEIWDQ